MGSVWSRSSIPATAARRSSSCATRATLRGGSWRPSTPSGSRSSGSRSAASSGRGSRSTLRSGSTGWCSCARRRTSGRRKVGTSERQPWGRRGARRRCAPPREGRARGRRQPASAGAPRMTYEEGMRVRREVLGDAHVDRANERKSGFTEDFQDLITRYAWGEIWTRPGLDRRTRSAITLTALVARGHYEELALHVRAALRNGLTSDEIAEVLLHSAIYCGVPAPNAAFRVAQRVLD